MILSDLISFLIGTSVFIICDVHSGQICLLLENKLESIPQLTFLHSETKTIPQIKETQKEELNDSTLKKIEKQSEELKEEKVLVVPV